MPRPSLPKAEDVAGIARLLRAEGFLSIQIDTTPSGEVSIKIDAVESKSNVSELEKWKAQREAS